MTPQRLAGVLAVLAFVLIGLLVWIRALRALAERRGHALFRERIAAAKADMKTEERTRLAIELHDSIAQTLTGVAFQIDAAQEVQRTSPTASMHFLESARSLLAACRTELRDCIWDLRSQTFAAHDMSEAVRQTLAPHCAGILLHIRFNVPRRVLSDATAHDILRIVRELVGNAIRHGHARNVRIVGEHHDGHVLFSVQDDGIGFDLTQAKGPSEGHFGLQGIRDRLRQRHGTLMFERNSTKGIKATVSFETTQEEKGQGHEH